MDDFTPAEEVWATIAGLNDAKHALQAMMRDRQRLGMLEREHLYPEEDYADDFGGAA